MQEELSRFAGLPIAEKLRVLGTGFSELTERIKHDLKWKRISQTLTRMLKKMETEKIYEEVPIWENRWDYQNLSVSLSYFQKCSAVMLRVNGLNGAIFQKVYDERPDPDLWYLYDENGLIFRCVETDVEGITEDMPLTEVGKFFEGATPADLKRKFN